MPDSVVRHCKACRKAFLVESDAVPDKICPDCAAYFPKTDSAPERGTLRLAANVLQLIGFVGLLSSVVLFFVEFTANHLQAAFYWLIGGSASSCFMLVAGGLVHVAVAIEADVHRVANRR